MGDVACDYCTQPATLVSAVTIAEPLCQACARDHYGSEWRDSTRKLGVRALRELNAHTTAYQGDTQ